MANKKLSVAQRLMLEQAAKGPILFETLDGYGRRVAGVLEDDELVTTVGENVELTDAGRSRLNGRRKVHAQPAPKANGKPKTNGNGVAASAKARVPPWYTDARAYVEARHREDLADLDRLAGLRQ